jgi:hypothetical protein
MMIETPRSQRLKSGEQQRTRIRKECLAFLLLVGCGASDQRQVLSGTVTLDGKPLTQGQIVFEPRDAGRMSMAQIDTGQYRLPAGYGLPPGEYVVRITSDRPTGKRVQPASYSEDQTPVELYEQFLPAKYNKRSELTVTVEPGTATTYDFALSEN